jgi:hypothetical protein
MSITDAVEISTAIGPIVTSPLRSGNAAKRWRQQVMDPQTFGGRLGRDVRRGLQALAHVQIDRERDLLALERLGLVRDGAQERDRVDLCRVERVALRGLRVRCVALRGLIVRVVAGARHGARTAGDGDVDRTRGLDRTVELGAHGFDRDLSLPSRLQHEHVDRLRLNHRAAAEAEAELHRSLDLLAQHLEAFELGQVDARLIGAL